MWINLNEYLYDIRTVVEMRDCYTNILLIFRSRLPELFVLEAPDPILSIFYRDRDCQFVENLDNLGKSGIANKTFQEECENRLAVSLGGSLKPILPVISKVKHCCQT